MAQFETPLSLFVLFAAVAILSLNPALAQTVRLPQTSIGFEKANYTFAEEDTGSFLSVNLIKRSNGASQQIFTIEFHVLPESAQYGVPSDGGDFVYFPNGSVVRMGPSLDTFSIDFFIFDDTKPEYNETILLTSSAAPGSPYFECNQDDGCFQSTRITIVDNDECSWLHGCGNGNELPQVQANVKLLRAVNIGFEHGTYSISEGSSSVEVCVQVKSGILWRPLNLSLTTADGDAISSADYASTSTVLRFGPSSTNQCVPIQIINDMDPEVPEQFRVKLAVATPLPDIRIVLTPNSATVTIHDDDVAPEPEVGCTIELFVLAATREREQQKVVETVQEVLPDILPTTDNTTNDTTSSLTSVYNSLTAEFGVNKSDSGYSKFVEAVNEITEAKQQACSGALGGRPSVDDVPRLVQEFRAAVGATQKDLSRLRTIFGQMLCIKDQTGVSDSMGRRRRQPRAPECDIPKRCILENCTCLPEECTCPLRGGIDGGCIFCPCEFFRCLDPKDELRPILGFGNGELQCLAFVVDTTGSMHDEIAAVQAVIQSFIRSEEELNETGCYILMPFNDYDDDIKTLSSVGPITVAITDGVQDLKKFLGAVNNLSAHEGGDCPEYALDGILQTLKARDEVNDFELMTAGSQIIVLTDAPSKNKSIEDQVVDQAKLRCVSIHFFLANKTGNCFSDVPGSVDSYRHIAQETGGSVVGNAWNFSNFVASYEKSPCVYPSDMPRGKRSASVNSLCQSFRVSRFTNLLKLSVRPSETGLSTITVRKPGGDTATPQVIDSNNNNRFAVFTELHPESGEWSVCVERGTVEVHPSPKTILDVVMLYPKNESHSSGASAVPTTSNTPPACTEGRIAIHTSRNAEMVSVYLNIVGNGRVVTRVPLHKCSKFLIGNTTFPFGTFTYELGGEDQDGNPFVYNTKKNTTFGPGNSFFTLSAVNGTSLDIDLYDIVLLTYELHNTNPYGSVTFNFTVQSAYGFSKFLWPYQATVGVGKSVQVTIIASVGSSRIRRGSSYIFTVMATNGCITLSASKTVNIRAPSTPPPPPGLCDCQNGGTCVVIERRGRQFPRCRCPPGLGGSKCQITY